MDGCLNSTGVARLAVRGRSTAPDVCSTGGDEARPSGLEAYRSPSTQFGISAANIHPWFHAREQRGLPTKMKDEVIEEGRPVN